MSDTTELHQDAAVGTQDTTSSKVDVGRRRAPRWQERVNAVP